jgi:hypothetical protein
MQENALDQARRDLAAARAREGLPSIEEPFDFERYGKSAVSFDELGEAPSVYISPAHRRQHAVDERRRRGMPIEEPDAAAVAEFADLIRLADEKRRGVNQPDVLPPPPQPPPRQMLTAEEILAAHRKATEGGKK